MEGRGSIPFHFDFRSISRRVHFSLRYLFDLRSMSLLCQVDVTSMALPFHFHFTARHLALVTGTQYLTPARKCQVPGG